MHNFLKNWNAIRIMRLLIGLGMAVYSVIQRDFIFIPFAVFFLAQAVFNVSCCGAGGCGTQNEAATQTKQVYQNEIKPYKGK